ncbi:MAG: hypothetical protein J0H55_05400 [Chitinophagaceae bacterium]|nr:hypothetical protein [Chitinophagaceae bacterium]
MKIIHVLVLFILMAPLSSLASDTTNIPVTRQVFHENIIEEQRLADKMDGRLDGMIKVGNNEEINLQVSDAIFRRVNALRNEIEINKNIPTNNDKVRYLRYLQNLVRGFINSWKDHSLPPSMAPALVENFSNIFYDNIRGKSMIPEIEKAPYEIGKINASIFTDNPGYARAKVILFRKFCVLHPDQILANIGPYVDEPFADSLVIDAFKNSPSQLYTYAQSTQSKQGKLINNIQDPRIKTVVELSKQPRALFYFPFLDNLISGKQTIDEIKKVAGFSDNSYDSVGYYKLLVKTEIGYYGRVIHGDTPVAMYGSDGLLDMLYRKALQHFITPINDLHENPSNAIRFKAIEPLSAQDLYYMMVLGENDIYTSSYKYSFDRMMQMMGPDPHADSFLLSLNFDKFKKFIKMAAGYNKLDEFLRTMAPENSEKLMQAFVLNLEKTNSLEDAVDVADSYGSITNPVLQKSMLANVDWNLNRCKKEDNIRGEKIYSVLKMIFLSADPKNNIDLSKEIGIPPVYTVSNKYLQDDSGRIIEQVFFYGDKDGIMSYQSYLTSFPSNDWTITDKKYWIEIRSRVGKPIWIYANKPLDNETNKDDEAQHKLDDYLQNQGLIPSIVIHRGHSYHLQYTIQQLPENTKIIMLGSCGGYQNLKTILDYAPEAHIISTKQTGAMNVNKPIIDYLDNTLREGKNIDWRQMWDSLTAQFNKAPKSLKETFDDYIPPQKNLGALFIKAYQKDNAGD